ncbi:MAG: phosphoglycerate kinase [Candidatus Nanohaloarchaea archaeon]|jgi:phosphoglycerate kinase
MNSIEDIDIEGKKLLLRTDLNLPVEEGEPQKTLRFERYMKTIEELSEKGAKVTVVAHQGRPARNDFLSLEKHAEMIEDSLGKEIEFIPSFFGNELSNNISSMEPGDIALLQNIRFLSEELQNAAPENHADDIFVKELSDNFDIYINDAFSVAHRSHGSMVGFNQHLESYPGSVMNAEIKGCTQVKENFEGGVMVLGGEKPSDLIGMLEEMIEDVEKVLLGGIPGEIALDVQGYSLGTKVDWIKEHGFHNKRNDLEQLIEEYSDKFVLPADIKTDSGNYSVDEVPENEMTWDIGDETVEIFSQYIQEADSVVMKGPMGAFEEHEEGTKSIVDAIANTDAYTVLGGGHTSSLIRRFGHEIDDFSHVSIAGGAFVRFMSGEELAAIKALEN